jgi:hypothetical protein
MKFMIKWGNGSILVLADQQPVPAPRSRAPFYGWMVGAALQAITPSGLIDNGLSIITAVKGGVTAFVSRFTNRTRAELELSMTSLFKSQKISFGLYFHKIRNGGFDVSE